MAQPDKKKRRIDKGTLLGLGIAFAGILGGLSLENGKLSDVSQLTAVLIVLGGTLGALLIGTPLAELSAALRSLDVVLFEPEDRSAEILAQMVRFSAKARRSGIIALEDELESVEDPFLKKALELAVDGAELSELRSTMEMDLDFEERRLLNRARIFESAGGYAPTLGILGAVLGLIQVLKQLANLDAVGHGIAMAFVATVYGVGSANILFFPAANKIRSHARRRVEVMELIVEGVSSIVEGLNPSVIQRKLGSLVQGVPAAPAEKIFRKTGVVPGAGKVEA